MPEQRILTAHYEMLDRSELTPEEASDLQIASIAREEAHAPYSNFLVGAAIRTADNSVFTGWNA